MLQKLPGLNRPAVSRYLAANPNLLSWFKRYNRGKSYREQVKPFNFLLAFQGVPFHQTEEGRYGRIVEPGEARRRKQAPLDQPRVASPYDTDLERAAENCFDRNTGKTISPKHLKTYRQVLAQYHMHPEDKFLNADYLDRGETGRRHILVGEVEYIGKEANRWEERWHLGDDPEYQIIYGTSPEQFQELVNEVLERCSKLGVRKVVRAASGISLREVHYLIQGESNPTPDTIAKLKQGIEKLEKQQQEHEQRVQDVITEVKQRCQEISVRQFAEQVGVDHSHLTQCLNGRRPMSRAMLSKLETYLAPHPV